MHPEDDLLVRDAAGFLPIRLRVTFEKPWRELF